MGPGLRLMSAAPHRRSFAAAQCRLLLVQCRSVIVESRSGGEGGACDLHRNIWKPSAGTPSEAEKSKKVFFTTKCALGEEGGSLQHGSPCRWQPWFFATGPPSRACGSDECLESHRHGPLPLMCSLQGIKQPTNGAVQQARTVGGVCQWPAFSLQVAHREATDGQLEAGNGPRRPVRRSSRTMQTKKVSSSWQDVFRLPNTLWQGGKPECLTSFLDTLRVWWRLSSSLYRQGSIHRGSGHWPNLARWSACRGPKMTSGNLAEAGCRWPLGAARKPHLRLKPRSLAALMSGPPKGMGVWALQVWAQGP